MPQSFLKIKNFSEAEKNITRELGDECFAAAH